MQEVDWSAEPHGDKPAYEMRCVRAGREWEVQAPVRDQADGDKVEGLAEKLASVVQELYAGGPGDDVTVAVVKARRKRVVALMAGPPADRGDDAKVVGALMSGPARRVVCGGTTGNIVARELGRGLAVELDTATENVPARGLIEGIDLVTEGVLTLTRALEMLRADEPAEKLRLRIDGASALALELLDADEVKMLVGRAMNPAHQNPKLPRTLGLKTQVVRALAEELRRRGKEVETTYY